MTIINPLPFNLTNGTTADATQVMADFNEIRNDVNSNAAHNGANSDITSLTGLTTPLSPAQGGTGSSAATAVWAQGYLFGMTLSNDSGGTTAIAISAGTCRDSTNADFMTLASALTGKVLVTAWSVGNGGGLLDTGAIGNNWYHVYIIKRPDTGVVDAIASLSASAPTLPANYTLYRRVGSVIRSAGAIILFSQLGDEFLWLVPLANATNATWTSTATLVPLTVPTGIQVWSLISVFFISQSGATVGLVTSPDQTNSAASATQCNMISFDTSDEASYNGEIRTDTSGQVRIRTSASTGTSGFLFTRGWIDTRGRLY